MFVVMWLENIFAFNVEMGTVLTALLSNTKASSEPFCFSLAMATAQPCRIFLYKSCLGNDTA